MKILVIIIFFKMVNYFIVIYIYIYYNKQQIRIKLST